MSRKYSIIKWKKLHPWMSSYYMAYNRCNNSHNYSYKWYGAKGIKMLLTSSEVKDLWHKCKAYLMKKPHLSRKKHNQSYTLNNCEFIEKNVMLRKEI